jgi:hypothetical protein
MFHSIKAAEKAALEGEGQDWDTQQCRLLQDEILSVRIGGSLAVRRSLYWDRTDAILVKPATRARSRLPFQQRRYNSFRIQD